MKIKKAILTGGGRATRLRPITTTINKHLIPLANKPMIFYAIEKAVEAGVEEIFINVNADETQLQQYVGDGGHWGIKITFFVQEGGPLGIAHVVKCAEKFIGNDPFMFYLSDNILLGSLKPLFEQFEKEKPDCQLAFAQVPDPGRFGVPRFNEAGTLVEVLEKPTVPPNNLAQTGFYLYGPKVFFEAFSHIKKSHRGEYEISDVHTYMLRNSYSVTWREITGWWKDTGLPVDLISANNSLLDQMPPSAFTVSSSTSQAQIHGKVALGGGATLDESVVLNGPVIIGENCTLKNCTIGPYVTIGSGSTISGGAHIEHSIIFSNATIDYARGLTSSIIGDNATLTTKRTDVMERVILGDHTLIEV